MMIRSIALPLALLLTIPDLSAQETVQPYDATGRYRTTGVEAQLTGRFGDGRDFVLSRGVLSAGGPSGRWMSRTELAFGIHAGQRLVDRLMLGPQVSLAMAVPGWYTALDRGTRAEPYLLLSAGAFGAADFRDETEVGIAPSIAVGVGLRLFDDEWDISLTQVELTVQQRFGILDQEPQLYVRFGRAIPRRRGSRPSAPHPDGPGSIQAPRHR